MKTLFDEVLERIRPDENETTKINKIYNNLKNEITKQNLDSLIVGSIAKGTNLKFSTHQDPENRTSVY